MGKRHDYIKKNVVKKYSHSNPAAPKLLLPSSQKYNEASADALIFLALEKNHTLRSGEDIANCISEITNGMRSYKQPYISKRINALNSTGFYARDRFWKIYKIDGIYKLANPHEEEEYELKGQFNSIPFDRTLYFRNDPNRGSTFGFKLKAITIEIMDEIKILFNKITMNHVFQVILIDDTVYIFLNTSSKLYREAVANLNKFVEENFELK